MSKHKIQNKHKFSRLSGIPLDFNFGAGQMSKLLFWNLGFEFILCFACLPVGRDFVIVIS
jgi:hypothetical protein